MTGKFAVVTDSTCDMPSDIAKARNIKVVPLYVLWGTESFKDGVDITSDQFYARLKSDSNSPTTSQPTVSDFVEAYKQAKEEQNADSVLAVVVSSQVSGTYNSAKQAVELVDFPVKIVDSYIASVSLGFLALEAADARDAGMSLDEAATHVESFVPKVKIYFSVATLEYLHRGGRIGGASRFIGEAFKIKPILWAKDGTVQPKDKVRTAKRALQRLVDIVNEESAGHKIKRLGIMHAQAEADVATLKELLKDLHPQEFMVVTVSAAVGTHAGPGLYGIGFQLE